MRAAGDSRPLFRKGVLCVHEPRDVVTVDDFIHVIDGKLVCYESNQFDWENPEDKKKLLDFVKILYETEELAAEYGVDSYVLIEYHREYHHSIFPSVASMKCLPENVQEKMRGALDEYKRRTGRKVFGE